MPVKTLVALAYGAFPEADHRAERCLTALREAVAQERAALRQWITAERDAGRWSFTHTREVQAWLDARERSEKA